MSDYAGALLVHDQKVLLVLRDNIQGIYNPNTWSLIGGALEDNETHEEALRRELFEEIGVVPKTFTQFRTCITKKGRDCKYYFSSLTAEEKENLELGDEGQELKFFKFEELSKITLSGEIERLVTDSPEALKEMILTEKPKQL